MRYDSLYDILILLNIVWSFRGGLKVYKNVLFDLDGTVTDPGIGITNSVAYALKKFSIKNIDRAELYKFIGPPLKDSFMKFYKFSEEESIQAVEYYREYFKEKGIFENKVIDGVTEVLEILKKSDKKIILATSKPETFALKILEHFDLLKYFDFIAGATMDGNRSKKGDVIRYALENCKISSLKDTIMVGDREQDIIGANQVGINSIGVLFGYGDREELENAKATYIVEKPEDLLDIIGIRIDILSKPLSINY